MQHENEDVTEESTWRRLTFNVNLLLETKGLIVPRAVDDASQQHNKRPAIVLANQNATRNKELIHNDEQQNWMPFSCHVIAFLGHVILRFAFFGPRLRVGREFLFN